VHELAITQSIVDQVAERMAGRRVTEVALEIGPLSGVVADSVRFCFDLVTVGTPLEGASLHIDEPGGTAHCTACETEFAVPDLLLLCPCGSADVRIVSGDELLIKSVKVV
jgi:hydrogenase nickel incorporation protein HypA/HybF